MPSLRLVALSHTSIVDERIGRFVYLTYSVDKLTLAAGVDQVVNKEGKPSSKRVSFLYRYANGCSLGSAGSSPTLNPGSVY